MPFVALAWKDRGDAAKSLKKNATKIHFNKYFFFVLLESSASSFRNFAESKTDVWNLKPKSKINDSVFQCLQKKTAALSLTLVGLFGVAV